MKPISIIALLIIAISIAIVISTSGDAGHYIDFAQAKAKSSQGDDGKFHIVGELARNLDGTPVLMDYKPTIDPNRFTFRLIDQKGEGCTVVYNNPIPQDFSKSEKIVIIGRNKGSVFYADKILLKCPSKYQENTLAKDATAKTL